MNSKGPSLHTCRARGHTVPQNAVHVLKEMSATNTNSTCGNERRRPCPFIDRGTTHLARHPRQAIIPPKGFERCYDSSTAVSDLGVAVVVRWCTLVQHRERFAEPLGEHVRPRAAPLPPFNKRGAAGGDRSRQGGIPHLRTWPSMALHKHNNIALLY